MAHSFDPSKVKFVEYHTLNHFDFNRVVSKDHSTEIMKSILKNDMCGVIRVTSVDKSLIENNGFSSLFILDGQHTALALHRMGMKIPVYPVDNDGTRSGLISVIAQFNTSSKAWKMSNYIEAWAKISKEYECLLNINKKYHIPYDAMAGFLYRDCSRKMLAGRLKSGAICYMAETEISLLKESCMELKSLLERLPIMPAANRQRLCLYLLAKRIPMTAVNINIMYRRIIDCNYAAAGTEQEMKEKILYEVIGTGQ